MDLVENSTTKKKYALKRIICHSVEDQRNATNEINYCKLFKHPNIIELIDSTFKGTVLQLFKFLKYYYFSVNLNMLF